MEQTLILQEPIVTGKDLKDYREGFGMSLNTFAGFFGLPRQEWARFEKLKRPIKGQEIMHLYNILTKKTDKNRRGNNTHR